MHFQINNQQKETKEYCEPLFHSEIFLNTSKVKKYGDEKSTA